METMTGEQARHQLAPSEWIIRFGRLVKFSHSIFALPFALSMGVLVARDWNVSATQVVWIVIAMVSARTAAMTFNRVMDRHIDAQNPRTRTREIPIGAVSLFEAWMLLLVSVLVFLGSAMLLGTHCLLLAPLVLMILLGYSLMKRVTTYSHLVLGLALALAPGGVWYALTGLWSLKPLSLMAAVLVWVAGFDILYSCQDFDFDRAHGLYSVPARFGITAAFWFARVLHLAAVLLLVLFGVSMHCGVIYFWGLALFAAVLASQHLLVSPRDLSRIDAAFFTRNGIASILFFVTVSLDVVFSNHG